MSVDEVATAPEEYQGQRVIVRGFLSFGDDRKNLWSSRDTYEKVAREGKDSGDPISNQCLSVLTTENSEYYALRGNDKTEVSLSGIVTIIDLTDRINLGFCSNIALSEPEIRR
tara:strand:- start:840 stop:1178 length:339 start_codon:yes stop_codon:yes gene_type:complete